MGNDNAALLGSLGFTAMVLAGCERMPRFAEDPTTVEIEGRIEAGTYHSPGGLFRVAVPEMRNPFVKQPTAIRDRRAADGDEAVDFSVIDLGEAHRYGVRPLADAADAEAVFLAELERWTRAWVGSFGQADRILEESVRLADGTGLARIYVVESASLLFVRQGEGAAARESALIGVLVVPVPQRECVLYVVSQFDMPNQGGHFTLETEKGRKVLAEEHVRRMRQLAETFRLP